MITTEQLKAFYTAIESHPFPKEFIVINADFDAGGFTPMMVGLDWLSVLMLDLKPTGHYLFWYMARNRDTDSNIAILRPQTKTEANRLSRAYKDMNQKNLVKRVEPAHYLINPSAIIPIRTYPEVLSHWESV